MARKAGAIPRMGGCGTKPGPLISAAKKWLKHVPYLVPAVTRVEQVGQLARRVVSYSNAVRVYEGLRLARFKDIHHRARRCLIIGNGPSIQQQDLTSLRDEVTFVTNWFVRHERYENISPTYYCVSDALTFEPDAYAEWGELMRQKTRNTVKFFPLGVRRTVNASGMLRDHAIHYLNFVHVPIEETRTISLDVQRVVYWGHTIILDLCIPLAHYMGFSEVYLLGCDCTLGRFTGDNAAGRHFYHAGAQKGRQQPDEYLRTSWQAHVFAGYEVAKAAFEATGRRIYNAGIGGELEVFERVSLEDVLSRPRS